MTERTSRAGGELPPQPEAPRRSRRPPTALWWLRRIRVHRHAVAAAATGLRRGLFERARRGLVRSLALLRRRAWAAPHAHRRPLFAPVRTTSEGGAPGRHEEVGESRGPRRAGLPRLPSDVERADAVPQIGHSSSRRQLRRAPVIAIHVWEGFFQRFLKIRRGRWQRRRASEQDGREDEASRALRRRLGQRAHRLVWNQRRLRAARPRFGRIGSVGENGSEVIRPREKDGKLPQPDGDLDLGAISRKPPK